MFKEFDITRIKMKQVENARSMVRKRFPDLIEGYLRDSKAYIENIIKFLTAENFNGVAKNAHALKSSSASLGITGIFEIARELENIAKEPERQSIDEMKYLIDLLKDAINHVEPILKGLLTDVA